MGNMIQGEFLFLSDMSNKINLICNASRVSMQHFLKSLFAQKPTLMNRVAVNAGMELTSLDAIRHF